jgi:hypothetical protein
MKQVSIPAIALIAFLAVDSAHALQVSKDAEGNILISGLQPKQTIDLSLGGVTQRKSFSTNACGVMLVKGINNSPIAASFTVENYWRDTVIPANLGLDLLPKCINGALQVPVYGIFRLPDGSVAVPNQEVNKVIFINYVGESIKKVTASVCGLSVVKPTSGLSTFKINGTDYNYSNLSVNLPSICRNGITYIPATNNAGGGGGDVNAPI